MTPLPAALGSTELVAWRLDDARFAETADSGEGAYRFGGRWNPPDTRVVYCALDPSTSILEVAAHSGFAELAARPHVLTSFDILEPSAVHVAEPEYIAPALLAGGTDISQAQRRFGGALLARHPFVVLPSIVSRESWNLLISRPAADGLYRQRSQQTFVLDQRLRTA